MKEALDKHEFCYGVLHNRKTAGTALKYIIQKQKQRRPKWEVMCFNHAMTYPQFLKEYSCGQAIFFIRDPILRFVSGFYSRLRQGQPRYFYPWKKKEAKAFARFTTPNELAEALSSKNLWKRYTAIQAMQSISHVKHTYQDFFGSIELLQQTKNRIAFIGHQTNFDSDLIILRQLLNIEEDITAPKDELDSHKNPTHFNTFLNEIGMNNLKKWYAEDYKIYAWCLKERVKKLELIKLSNAFCHEGISVRK